MLNCNNKQIKTICIGKFYFLHDGSRTGHPCYVIWKDDNKNRYLVVRFDSDKFNEKSKVEKGVRHITRLATPTNRLVATSYVRNRPMLCKRRDFGSELKDLKLSSSDIDLIFKISKNRPEYSPSFKK